MKSLTYLILIAFMIFLLSLTSCVVIKENNFHNNYGKFYSSSGSFRMNKSIIRDDETHVIFISEEIIALYYKDSYRNLVIKVRPRVHSRKFKSYDMLCANEMFTISERTSQFFISKLNDEGIPQKPYIIFYNLKEIK